VRRGTPSRFTLKTGYGTLRLTRYRDNLSRYLQRLDEAISGIEKRVAAHEKRIGLLPDETRTFALKLQATMLDSLLFLRQQREDAKHDLSGLREPGRE